MSPLVSERCGRCRPAMYRGVAAGEHTLGWPVRGGQPLRWWLSSDTDVLWLDRYGEDALTSLPRLERTVTVRQPPEWSNPSLTTKRPI